MPHITIEMYPGRDEEIKKELAKAVADTLSKQLSMREDAISVSIREVAKEDWKSEVYDKVVEDKDKEVYIKPGYNM